MSFWIKPTNFFNASVGQILSVYIRDIRDEIEMAEIIEQHFAPTFFIHLFLKILYRRCRDQIR